MNLAHLVRGLTLLLQQSPNGEGEEASTFDGALYVGSAPPQQLPPQILSELTELGWFWDDVSDCWKHFA